MPVGLAWAQFCSWAHRAWVFIEKKLNYGRYNIVTYNMLFYKPPGRQELMDGIGWVWMMLSQLGKQSQFGLLRLGFAPGLIGLGFL